MGTSKQRIGGAWLLAIAATASATLLLASPGCSEDETVAVNYAECPNAVPTAGTPCTPEGLQCPYVDPSGQGSAVCRADCAGGAWVLDAGCEAAGAGGAGGSNGGAGGGGVGGAGGGGVGGAGGGSVGGAGGGSVGGAGGQLGTGGAGG